MKKMFDTNRKVWLYSNGTVAYTEEQRLNRELFDAKWRMLHYEGKSDVKKMMTEFEAIKEGKQL